MARPVLPRTRNLRDRPLKPEEVQHFTDTARRIGADIVGLVRETPVTLSYCSVMGIQLHLSRANILDKLSPRISNKQLFEVCSNAIDEKKPIRLRKFHKSGIQYPLDQ